MVIGFMVLVFECLVVGDYGGYDGLVVYDVFMNCSVDV